MIERSRAVCDVNEAVFHPFPPGFGIPRILRAYKLSVVESRLIVLSTCTKEQECVYKQKKKPGLRAGIGRELEERLGGIPPYDYYDRGANPASMAQYRPSREYARLTCKNPRSTGQNPTALLSIKSVDKVAPLFSDLTLGASFI